ncbi:Glyoxalase/Bleomycin resistance protein/Dihydroxybiphenyl dioxygenase [Ramaria rubella]|nr:Glyoxalase/Bleomycin resistance protein/Dihydroxybiphenyl dioxygenase [Ramaria rubella]
MSEPGVHILGNSPPQPEETLGLRLNHFMLRIKDPARTLKFYEEGLGMRRIFTFNPGFWTIYYLGHPSTPDESSADMAATLGSRKGLYTTGLLELYHIPHHPQSTYELGNGNAPGHEGFGHIGFTAPDVEKTVARLLKVCPDTVIVKPLGSDEFDTMQVPKGPNGEGGEAIAEGYNKIFKQIWYCKDPDGYILEIVPEKVIV